MDGEVAKRVTSVHEYSIWAVKSSNDEQVLQVVAVGVGRAHPVGDRVTQDQDVARRGVGVRRRHRAARD